MRRKVSQEVKLNNKNTSAQCRGLDPEEHKHLKTSVSFPVSHGQTVSVSCKDGYMIHSSGNILITCVEETEFAHQSRIICSGKLLLIVTYTTVAFSTKFRINLYVTDFELYKVR